MAKTVNNADIDSNSIILCVGVTKIENVNQEHLAESVSMDF